MRKPIKSPLSAPSFDVAQDRASGSAATLHADAAYPGKVRIIGGRWRGSVLSVPALPGLRPTGARIRETLFNWLQPRIAGSHCLDLFAGSGALGLEAASRGAAHVTLVESHPLAGQYLQQAIHKLHAAQVELRQMGALDFLAGTPQRYDIVFIDPPFADDLQAASFQALAKHALLKPAAHIFTETPRQLTLPSLPAGWRAAREKTAGEVRYALIIADEEQP